ncbi:hypothetical protein BDR06DRAFT_1037559 [Suillus hirtellus]|nr:hypothetical protein BDR06DRAFT_1037559 [Suillus hirtellus]
MSTTTIMVSQFPLKILQEILSLACCFPQDAARIMRVSSRTHPWIERIMYQKINLSEDYKMNDFMACLQLCLMPVQFANTAINSLWLDGHVDALTMLEILSICSGVKHLALMVRISPTPDELLAIWLALDRMPLRSLCLYMGMKFLKSIDKFSGLCHITHLDLVDGEVLTKANMCLDALYTLTHISVMLSVHHSEPVAILRLVTNARLCVIGFRVNDLHIEVESFLAASGIQDQRMLLLPTRTTRWCGIGQREMLFWDCLDERLRLPEARNSYGDCTKCKQVKLGYDMEVDDGGDVECNPENDTGSDSEGDPGNSDVMEANSDPGVGTVQAYIMSRTKLNVVPSCLSRDFILGIVGDEDWDTCIEHHPATHYEGDIKGDQAGATGLDSQGQPDGDIQDD